MTFVFYPQILPRLIESICWAYYSRIGNGHRIKRHTLAYTTDAIYGLCTQQEINNLLCYIPLIRYLICWGNLFHHQRVLANAHAIYNHSDFTITHWNMNIDIFNNVLWNRSVTCEDVFWTALKVIQYAEKLPTQHTWNKKNFSQLFVANGVHLISSRTFKS